MASLIVKDRVKETTTSTTTGDVALAGAVTGYQAFKTVMADGDTCPYCIAGTSEWETGVGTFVAATTSLSRTTVLQSSNAGSAVNFSAGTKDVFITRTADRMPLPELATDPATPASGNLFYTKALAGRFVPRFVGPSGLDSAVQPCLWGNSVVLWLPGTAAVAAISFGVSWTISATQAHPAIADTNVMTSIRRATYTTTTTAGNQSGTRSTAQVAIRNRGFFFAARWGINTYSSSMQAWCGLSAVSGAIAGEPSAQNDTIAMSKDSTETVWQVMTRDTSAATKKTTGRTTAAAGNTEVFDFFAYCKPSDTKITSRVVDIATDTVVLTDTNSTANLPTGTTPLYAHCECRNSAGGVGSAVAAFLSKMYVESDL